MRPWSAQRVADAAGALLLNRPESSGGPERVTSDSRQAGPDALFVGLPGANLDGGRFAPQALAAGTWGVLSTPDHARPAAETAGPGAAILACPDPLDGLQRLATAWRHELGARVIGVTGSTG